MKFATQHSFSVAAEYLRASANYLPHQVNKMKQKQMHYSSHFSLCVWPQNNDK